MRHRLLLPLWALFLLVGWLTQTAQGQIIWTSDPKFRNDTPWVSSPYHLIPSISQFAATATDNGFKLTGDLTLVHDRSADPLPDGAQPIFQLIVERPFTVAPLPVKTYGSLLEHFEVVLGNGSATAPRLDFRTYGMFFVNDGGYPIISALNVGGLGSAPEDFGATVSLTGNSFQIFDTTSTGAEYILGPGLNYWMEYRIEAWIDHSDLSLNDPPTTVTFEFGGVSHFSGIEASAVGILLPEPSSIALLAMGLGCIVAGPLKRRVRLNQRGLSAFSIMAAMTLLVTSSADAAAVPVYDTAILGNTHFSGTSAFTNFETGNQVRLAGNARRLISFSFSVKPQGQPTTADVQARFYANDGPGDAPGTLLGQTPVSTITTSGEYFGIGWGGGLLDFRVPDVFTWTVQITNATPLPLGLAQITPPPGLGECLDGWFGSSAIGWTQTGGAVFQASMFAVPEPSSIHLLFGATAMAAFILSSRRLHGNMTNRRRRVLRQKEPIVGRCCADVPRYRQGSRKSTVRRGLALTLALLTAPALLITQPSSAVAGAFSFTPVEVGLGSDFSSRATAVSADGSVVVGYTYSNTEVEEAARWTGSGVRMAGLNDFPGFSLAYGVSADGAVVVGQGLLAGAYQAFRWTAVEGMVGLGGISAYDVSADGGVVVGVGGSGPGDEAFRWTEGGGIVALGDLPGGIFFSAATGVSADGSVIVGYGNSASGSEAFRWTAGEGMVGLGDLPGGDFGSGAMAVSADGAVVVGYGTSASGTEAFRWTAGGGMAGLGDLPGGSFQSEATGVSADGAVVVGWGNSASGQEAFLWTEDGGMISLKDLLVANGVGNLTGWTLSEATGVSADGRTIVGSGINPDGRWHAWIATVPEPSTWALALGGLASLAIPALTHRRRAMRKYHEH